MSMNEKNKPQAKNQDPGAAIIAAAATIAIIFIVVSIDNILRPLLLLISPLPLLILALEKTYDATVKSCAIVTLVLIFTYVTGIFDFMGGVLVLIAFLVMLIPLPIIIAAMIESHRIKKTDAICFRFIR